MPETTRPGGMCQISAPHLEPRSGCSLTRHRRNHIPIFKFRIPDSKFRISNSERTILSSHVMHLNFASWGIWYGFELGFGDWDLRLSYVALPAMTGGGAALPLSGPPMRSNILENISSGRGNTMVVFFSTPISVNVCRYRN